MIGLSILIFCGYIYSGYVGLLVGRMLVNKDNMNNRTIAENVGLISGLISGIFMSFFIIFISIFLRT